MNDNTLLTIFGAKVNNNKVVLTLISGEGDNRKYYTACVKLDGSQKTKAEVDDFNNVARLEVPLLVKPSDDTPF